MTVQQAHPRLRPDCGAAFSVEKEGREILVVVHEIERHKQGRLDVVLESIRRAIAREHDLGVDAIVLIRAGSVPKTSSGKIQRHACREGYLQGTLDVVGRWQAEADGSAGASQPRANGTVLARPRCAAPTGLPGAFPRLGASAERKKGRRSIRRRASSRSSRRQTDTRRAARRTATRRRLAIGKAHAHDPVAATPKNGHGPARGGSTTDLVVEEIRRVAKERAAGMTLDSPIAEAGLDSLERMEILASLEERFGGRFPPEILSELETTRQVIAAVEKYLGSRTSADRRPPGRRRRFRRRTIASSCFPSTSSCGERLDLLDDPDVGNPYFGVHQGITNDRTMIGGQRVDQLRQLQLRGHFRRSVPSRRPPRRPSTATARACRPAAWPPARSSLHGDLERPIARFVGTEAAIDLRRRPFDERDGHRPPGRAGRPGPARCLGPQQHHSRGHPLRRPAPAVHAQRLAGRRPAAGAVSGTSIAAC